MQTVPYIDFISDNSLAIVKGYSEVGNLVSVHRSH